MGVQEKAVLFAASAKLHEVSSHPCLEVKEAKQGSRYMSKREQAKKWAKAKSKKACENSSRKQSVEAAGSGSPRMCTNTL